MGRRKIAIEPITDERNRSVTFLKRKAGLFKKAHELSVLCQADIALVIIGNNGKIFEYSSSSVDKIMKDYTQNNVQESKTSQDFFGAGGSSRQRPHSRSSSAHDDGSDNSGSEDEASEDHKYVERSSSASHKTQRTRAAVAAGRSRQQSQSSIGGSTPLLEQTGMPRGVGGQPLPAGALGQPSGTLTMPRQIPDHLHGMAAQQQMLEAQQMAKYGASPAMLSQGQLPSPGAYRYPPGLGPNQTFFGDPALSDVQMGYRLRSPTVSDAPGHINATPSPHPSGDEKSGRPKLTVQIPGTEPAPSYGSTSSQGSDKEKEQKLSSGGPRSATWGGPQSPPIYLTSGGQRTAGTEPPQMNRMMLVNGEQTPLSAALPSRYMGDMFPSPSAYFAAEFGVNFPGGPTSANGPGPSGFFRGQPVGSTPTANRGPQPPLQPYNQQSAAAAAAAAAGAGAGTGGTAVPSSSGGLPSGTIPSALLFSAGGQSRGMGQDLFPSPLQFTPTDKHKRNRSGNTKTGAKKPRHDKP